MFAIQNKKGSSWKNDILIVTFKKNGFADLVAIPEPRPVGSKGQAPPRDEEDKFMTRVIRLNNNFFADLSKFQGVMESIMADPSMISWIDFSFNSLPKIDHVSFTNLSV